MVVPVLLGVSVIVFLVISLIPGDPARAILGTFATPENIADVTRQLGALVGCTALSPAGSA